MSAQIGIPKYKDIINDEYLKTIKNKINQICLLYGKLSNDKVVENRESDDFEKYSSQYYDDLYNIQSLINYSQDLINDLNHCSFAISTRAIKEHK